MDSVIRTLSVKKPEYAQVKDGKLEMITATIGNIFENIC